MSPDPPLSRTPQGAKLANLHRLVLTFDDGLSAELIHPEGGCVGSHQCGHCAADLTDPESERCYDCKGDGPHECWVKGWFDNCSPDELLHGSVTVDIDAEWNYDHMTARIVEPTTTTGRKS